MSSSVVKPLQISRSTFLGLLWGCAGVSLVFVISRIYVRLKVFNRFFSDDALVLAAWSMLLAQVIVFQKVVGAEYLLYDVEAGAVPPPADFTSQIESFLHAEVAINLLYLCGIWAIKLSFMLFFRRLGHNVKWQKQLWWCVLIAIIAGLGISIGVLDFPCLVKPIAITEVTCTTASARAFQRLSLRIITGCDVITDALVLSIPIHLLWKVHISTRYKLALLGVFSLTLFIMAVSIARVILAIDSGPQVDDSWLYTWSAIEHAVAIIIACLVSWRSLFAKESVPKHRHNGYSGLSALRYWHGLRSSRKSAQNDTLVPAVGKDSFSQGSLGEEVMPLQTIHVRHEYTVFPESKLDAEQGHKV